MCVCVYGERESLGGGLEIRGCHLGYPIVAATCWNLETGGLAYFLISHLPSSTWFLKTFSKPSLSLALSTSLSLVEHNICKVRKLPRTEESSRSKPCFWLFNFLAVLFFNSAANFLLQDPWIIKPNSQKDP